MELIWTLDNLTPTALVDILLVALFFFGLSFLFRGTQAIALLRGTLLLLVGMVAISNLFSLTAVGWLLANILTVVAVALPVIFQPELRRALERLGRGSILTNRQSSDQVRTNVIEEVCRAAERLSERRHGALIVLQRQSALAEFVRTGVAMNSDVNAQILLTIFWPKTELHDGAAIIDSGGRIAAAACVLPLTANRNLPSRKMGTRHRAALGISEVSDALCVVISEETGKIAITNGGRMVSRLDADRLRTILNAFYGPSTDSGDSIWGRLRDSVQGLIASTREELGASRRSQQGG